MLKYIFEKREFYNIGDIVIIEWWYNRMITPVKIIDVVGRKYKVSHNIEESKIFNAPDELISSKEVIDYFKFLRS
jgi:hypothetical protein